MPPMPWMFKSDSRPKPLPLLSHPDINLDHLLILTEEYLNYLRGKHKSSNGCSNRKEAIFDSVLTALYGPEIMEEIAYHTKHISC